MRDKKPWIGIIEIDSLDIRYPIYQGATEAQLSKGIGHLPETAGLLEKGNCVLCGHNGSSRGLFFTTLSHIRKGAQVKSDDSQIKGFATVTFGDSILVRNIAIIQRRDSENKKRQGVHNGQLAFFLLYLWREGSYYRFIIPRGFLYQMESSMSHPFKVLDERLHALPICLRIPL